MSLKGVCKMIGIPMIFRILENNNENNAKLKTLEIVLVKKNFNLKL